jgi:hypothetical protein
MSRAIDEDGRSVHGVLLLDSRITPSRCADDSVRGNLQIPFTPVGGSRLARRGGRSTEVSVLVTKP